MEHLEPFLYHHEEFSTMAHPDVFFSTWYSVLDSTFTLSPFEWLNRLRFSEHSGGRAPHPHPWSHQLLQLNRFCASLLKVKSDYCWETRQRRASACCRDGGNSVVIAVAPSYYYLFVLFINEEMSPLPLLLSSCWRSFKACSPSTTRDTSWLMNSSRTSSSSSSTCRTWVPTPPRFYAYIIGSRGPSYADMTSGVSPMARCVIRWDTLSHRGSILSECSVADSYSIEPMVKGAVSKESKTADASSSHNHPYMPPLDTKYSLWRINEVTSRQFPL